MKVVYKVSLFSHLCSNLLSAAETWNHPSESLVQNIDHKKEKDTVDAVEHLFVSLSLFLNHIEQFSCNTSLALYILEVLDGFVLHSFTLAAEVDFDVSCHVFTGIAYLLGIFKLLSLSQHLAISLIL